MFKLGISIYGDIVELLPLINFLKCLSGETIQTSFYTYLPSTPGFKLINSDSTEAGSPIQGDHSYSWNDLTLPQFPHPIEVRD